MIRELAVIALVASSACKFESPAAPVDGPAGATVGFANGATLVDEISGAIEIPVTLAGTDSATVQYDVTGGGATAGDDYTFAAGTLTFGAAGTESIDLAILNDTLQETDETIEITLSNPSGAALATATHVVTISADILPRVRFTTLTTSGDETLAGTLELQLDLPPKQQVSITLALTGSAGATDYGLANNTVVTFEADETMRQVSLAVAPDGLDEPDEDVIADLSTPVGIVIDTTSSTATHTITDVDGPPSVAFSIDTSVTSEGATFDVQVELSGPSGLPIEIGFERDGASAAAVGGDFTFVSTSPLTFAPGETIRNITLQIANDGIGEASEDLILNLINPVNVELKGTIVHTVRIGDDDCFGTAPFVVCPSIEPTNTVTLSGTFNTTNDSACTLGSTMLLWTSQGQPEACVVIAADIDVQNVAITGTRPLVLFATGTITVSGTLDASGTGTTNAHAAPSTLCAAFPTAPGSAGTGGGGGAGASFMTLGGNGGAANGGPTLGGTAPAADAADPVVLRSGCKGQDGGPGGGGNNSRGVGGGGGGVVYLIGGKIVVSGAIDVSGGGGAPGRGNAGNNSGGGGGGGSGGMILIDSASLDLGGTFIANGGGGGQGADVDTNGGPGGEPSVLAPLVAALGGALANAGGNGGNGMAFDSAANIEATIGLDGIATTGGGAGGGAGGYIRSTGTITGPVSAGKIVQP